MASNIVDSLFSTKYFRGESKVFMRSIECNARKSGQNHCDGGYTVLFTTKKVGVLTLYDVASGFGKLLC